ncbi:hypothetical protein SAMN05421810_103275 [Amycolatopsis arida]|uniref:Uncharacterized protein n=1 Tax=Amycolatopsis arida TaxID=587909 RepID=A0A1I5SUL5_9PSEU|nr:hypothetical protein CLV69_103483 [Amycolatopsis arida]SFP74311.1 hypothetical protein SAMN05421810_103275 [Amycolatopsis arida]
MSLAPRAAELHGGDHAPARGSEIPSGTVVPRAEHLVRPPWPGCPQPARNVDDVPSGSAFSATQQQRQIDWTWGRPPGSGGGCSRGVARARRIPRLSRLCGRCSARSAAVLPPTVPPSQVPGGVRGDRCRLLSVLAAGDHGMPTWRTGHRRGSPAAGRRRAGRPTTRRARPGAGRRPPASSAARRRPRRSSGTSTDRGECRGATTNGRCGHGQELGPRVPSANRTRRALGQPDSACPRPTGLGVPSSRLGRCRRAAKGRAGASSQMSSVP